MSTASARSATRVPGEIRIGCSGWTYDSWKGRYYPEGLPASRWLDFYTRDFTCVEVNGSFYRLPETATFAKWAVETPGGFLMAVKASRYLTHMKRLRDPAPPLERLLSRAAALESRLGPVLYQLPPQMARDDQRLAVFLAALPRTIGTGRQRRRLRHVIEFRDPSWYVDATFAQLTDHGVAWCLHDMQGSALDGPMEGPFVYVRFHGTSGRYHGSYSRTMLARWAERLAEAATRGLDVFAFFNNDPEATAVANALDLRAAVQRVMGVRARRRRRACPPVARAAADAAASRPRSTP